ncbi:MAG: ABC transporter permease, partial [SAR86 cluster bacterium]
TIAFITLILAVTGIYAIISRSVSQRAKEIGIRRAVGSSNGDVLWVFIRQGLKYLGIGLLIGGGAAILSSNELNSDTLTLLDWLPLVFTSVSVLLIFLVLAATYSPARALVAMEPGETLRDD